MKYLFDTTAYSHLVNGHLGVAKLLRGADMVLLPNVVVAELRYGFALGSKQEQNERLLARFLASQKIKLALPDSATTDYFVTIAAHARRNGVQLSTHDLWIAALAEQWEASLVTFDNDFTYLKRDELKLVTMQQQVH